MHDVSMLPKGARQNLLDPFAAAAAIAAIGLSLILGPPVAPVEEVDSVEYVAVSENLGSEWAQDRPLAYPLLLRLCRLVFHADWPTAVMWLQIAMLGLVSWVVCRALRRQGVAGGLAAAAGVAASATPALIFYSRSLLPEVLLPLCIVLAWAATLRCMDAKAEDHPIRLAAIAGLWSGIAVLTKPVWILGALPLAIGVLFWGRSPQATRLRSAVVLLVVHGVLALGWQAILYVRFGQLRPSRTGTIALNFAGIRHGMTRFGSGTPLYQHLEQAGLLSTALNLKWEDQDAFNRVKNGVPDEFRIDTRFEKAVVRDHLGLYVRKQLPRLPAFFSTRPLIEGHRSGGGLAGALRKLHRLVYALYFRVGGRTLSSPCLVLFLAAAAWAFSRPDLRGFIVVSILCVANVWLLTVFLSFQDSTLARYRTEVEPILFAVTLLPLCVGIGRVFGAGKLRKPLHANPAER